MIQLLIILILLLYVFHKYMSKDYNYWEKRNVPFLKPLPFVGNMSGICLQKYDMGSYFAELYNRSKEPYFGIFMFSKPALIIKDLEMAKNILVRDFDNFCDRNIYAAHYEPATAHMLFVEKGNDWRVIRKEVTPCFSPNKLKNLYSAIDGISLNLRDYITKNKENKYIDVKETSCKYTIDVIVKCLFGINAFSFERDDGEFLKIGKKVFDTRLITSVRFLSFFFYHSVVKFFKMRLFNPEVIDFLRKVLWESIELREKENIEVNDLLDVLIELRKNKEFRESWNFEGDRVIAQAFMFFVAGFDTTASTVSFALYELCIHPEIQKKLRSDIRETIGKYGGKLTYESVAEINYLNMVIKETLRKYPALPFLDRVVTATTKLPGTDLVLEKGTPIILPTFGLHYDPDIYPEPQKFIPERFEQDRRDVSYLPFGKGPRGCIGERFGLLATRLALVRVLNEFELERTDQTPVPLIFQPGCLLLSASKPMLLKFIKTEPLF